MDAWNDFTSVYEDGDVPLFSEVPEHVPINMPMIQNDDYFRLILFGKSEPKRLEKPVENR